MAGHSAMNRECSCPSGTECEYHKQRRLAGEDDFTAQDEMLDRLGITRFTSWYELRASVAPTARINWTYDDIPTNLIQ